MLRYRRHRGEAALPSAGMMNEKLVRERIKISCFDTQEERKHSDYLCPLFTLRLPVRIGITSQRARHL